MAATAEETISLNSNKFKAGSLLRRFQKSNSISSILFIGKKTLPPELVDESVIAEVVNILNTDRTVTSLVLSNTAVKSPIHQVAILKAACNATNLKNLELYGIQLKDIPEDILLKLSSLPLTALCLYAYPAPNQTFIFGKEIAQLVFQNKALASLRIANMSLSNDAVHVMAGADHLQTLILQNTNISQDNLIMLVGKGEMSLLEIIEESSDNGSEPPLMPADLQNALLHNTTLEHFYSPYSIAPFVKELDARLESNRKNNLSSETVTYIHREGIDVFGRDHVHPELFDHVIRSLNDARKDILQNLVNIAGFTMNAFWIDHGSYDRNTYLHMLIANEHQVEVVLKLLKEMKEFINPNEFDFEWKNLLIVSAKVYSADEVFKQLLETYGEKLDLNANDMYGRTALHYICAYGKLNLLQALLSSKLPLDLLVEDFEGRTALDYCELPEAEIKEILESIYIDASRDANANQNNLKTFIKSLDLDFDIGFVDVPYEEVQRLLNIFLQRADQASEKHKESAQLYEEYKQQCSLIEQAKGQEALAAQFQDALAKEEIVGKRLDEVYKELKLLNAQSTEAQAQYEKARAGNELQMKIFNNLYAVPTVESLHRLKNMILEEVKDKVRQEQLELSYNELEKGFAGISVIAKIMASRQALKVLLLQKILEVHGEKGSLKSTSTKVQTRDDQILQASANLAMEAPNQQVQSSLLLLQEVQQAQAIKPQIEVVTPQLEALEKSSLSNTPDNK